MSERSFVTLQAFYLLLLNHRLPYIGVVIAETPGRYTGQLVFLGEVDARLDGRFVLKPEDVLVPVLHIFDSVLLEAGVPRFRSLFLLNERFKVLHQQGAVALQIARAVDFPFANVEWHAHDQLVARNAVRQKIL